MNPKKPLSPRQREIMRLSFRGLSEKEIAGELGISRSTLVCHKMKIFARLGARNWSQATYRFISIRE